MTIRLYGILTDGLNKPIVNATVSLIARSNTLIVLGSSEAIFRTDSQGAYNITVNPGHYVVIVGPQGKEPYKAGEIVLYADSPEGSLNGYLVNWVEEELTPDVIKQVQQLVANSEEYALQAGRSAAAANADATDARNSKASAAQSASDALVYKNDAKASEDAAKQAQAGAAGSANTATQAVTTIQGLKSDVEQLKTDTQGIKDSAVTETTALKDAAAASAAQASNSATEAGQQASNAAGSAQSASTDAGRAEVAAGKAEQVISQALLKDNNLSDLTNIDSARSVLKIDRIDQTKHESRLKSNQDKQYLFINTNNLNIPGSSAWGVYNTEEGMVPLTIECGGTGARQPDHVRINLDVPSNAEAFLIKNNLSEITDKDSAWKNVRPEGSLPLSGDPVNDYDATTQRWVRNLFNIGTVGPTMNGVMNYGVGDFHLRDSRAYIQPYEVVSDGQLLNRADWPELWAYAQMLSPISDAEWLADPHERGKYSVGDGQTTFRVPDRNGVQSGSIKGLFGRGDGGVVSNIGRANESSAPNLTAYFRTVTSTSIIENDGASGAGYPSETNQKYANLNAIVENASVTNYPRRWNFDASRQSSVYGRYGNTEEITTNNFTGVWVIRASGGFVAANTSWSVVNSDSTRPNASTLASSGKVLSQYKIGESLEAQAEFRSDAYIDGMYYAIMSIYNNTKGVKKELAFDDSGTLNSDRYSARYGTMMAWIQTGSTKGTFSMEDQAIGANYAFNSLLSGAQSSQSGYKTSCHWGMIHHNATSFAQSVWHIAGDDNNAYGVRVGIQPLNSDIYFHKWQPGSEETYTLQKNATSDRRLKHSIENTTVEKALENIKNLNFVTFVYNNDNLQRVRRGVIAQETEVIEPLYVKTRKFYDNSGIEQEQKELDTTPMLLDTIHVVQTLIKRIESLEEDNKKLKEIISNLNTSQTTDLP